jgi:hypothetical protein
MIRPQYAVHLPHSSTLNLPHLAAALPRDPMTVARYHFGMWDPLPKLLEFIDRKLAEHGLTEAQARRSAGITNRDLFRNARRGSMPETRNLHLIAKALRVTYEELVQFIQEPVGPDTQISLTYLANTNADNAPARAKAAARLVLGMAYARQITLSVEDAAAMIELVVEKMQETDGADDERLKVAVDMALSLLKR